MPIPLLYTDDFTLFVTSPNLKFCFSTRQASLDRIASYFDFLGLRNTTPNCIVYKKSCEIPISPRPKKLTFKFALTTFATRDNPYIDCLNSLLDRLNNRNIHNLLELSVLRAHTHGCIRTVSNQYVGLAMYCPQRNLNLRIRISSYASITTAKALAIQLTLKYIVTHQRPNSTIFTDSLSTEGRYTCRSRVWPNGSVRSTASSPSISPRHLPDTSTSAAVFIVSVYIIARRVRGVPWSRRRRRT